MSKLINLVGQTFGKLKVLNYDSQNKHGQSIWSCVCDCGNKIKVLSMCLRNNDTKSCGCWRKENGYIRGKNSIVHGMWKSPEYRIFISMKERCYNKNHISYKNYGGRGIEVKYISFQEFLNDVGKRPDKKYQVNRINNDGHYEKGNVNWVLPKDNCNNRRPPERRSHGQVL